MEQSSIIFNSEVNTFARKFLVEGTPLSKIEIAAFPIRHHEVASGILEQLLLFDRISFKVYGENIPLAILINVLGVKNIEELLEQGALEFLLWTPMVFHNVTELENVLPLQSGIPSSPVHKDPEESLKLGLQWLTKQPPPHKIKELQKRVLANYKVPEKDFAANAVSTVVDAYKSNKLSGLGMPNQTEITRLSLIERENLSKLAQTVLETAVLSRFKYSSYEQQNEFALSTATFTQIQTATKLKENLGQLFELENLPDFKSFFLENKIKTDELIKLRAGNDASKFRNWLFSVSSSSDAKSITKDYLDSIVNAKGFFETKGGKFVKTMSMYSIGTGIGALIGGIPGSVLGGVAAKILDPVADIGLDMLDTYYLDGLTKGWTPRLYLNKIKEKTELK